MAVNRHPGEPSAWTIAAIGVLCLAAMLGAWWVSFSAMPEGTSLVIHIAMNLMIIEGAKALLNWLLDQADAHAMRRWRRRRSGW